MGFWEGLNKVAKTLNEMQERAERSKTREAQRIKASQDRYRSWSDERLKREYRSLSDRQDDFFFSKEDFIAVKRELRDRGFGV